MMNRLLSVVVAAAIAACAGPEGAVPVELLTRELCVGPWCDDPEPYVCPPDGCGTNSATVGDGIVFDELYLGPGTVWNKGGVRIVGARKCPSVNDISQNGDACTGVVRSVQIRIRGDRLVVGEQTVADDDDVKGHLLVEIEHQSGARYELYFRRAIPAPYWTTGRMAGETVAYEVLFRATVSTESMSLPVEPNFAGQRTICASTPDSSGMRQALAVVFAGDRYDDDAKTVTDVDPDGGWFNLACKGTAAWKMHRLRHTAAAAPPRGAKTVEQRQAMLKMLTADYCGGGHTFTRTGVSLRYEDAAGWFRPSPPIDLTSPEDQSAVEAIWGSDGARCLNDPRLRPDITAKIAAACALRGKPVPPRCPAEESPAWRTLGDVLSAQPGPLSALPPP
jgi:hypothetical protein